MQESFRVAAAAAPVTGFVPDPLQEAVLDVAVVHRYRVATGGDDVAAVVGRLAADHVGVGIRHQATLAALGGVANVGQEGVVAGAGHDLVEIDQVHRLYRADPLHRVDASGSDAGNAHRVAAAVLQRLDERVGVVQRVGHAETAIVIDVLAHRPFRPARDTS